MSTPVFAILAIAYWERESGDHGSNLERGVQHLLEARAGWRLPLQLARLHANLGVMYIDRVVGARHDNIEQAIAYTRRAVSVFNRADFPVRYGQQLLNLSAMYAERIAGEREDNLAEAASLLREALEIRTLQDFPSEYAVTQDALASVLIKTGDIDGALACCLNALKVWTIELSPRDTRSTQLRLAGLWCRQGRRQEAHECYRTVMRAEDLLLALGSGVAGHGCVNTAAKQAPAPVPAPVTGSAISRATCTAPSLGAISPISRPIRHRTPASSTGQPSNSLAGDTTQVRLPNRVAL